MAKFKKGDRVWYDGGDRASACEPGWCVVAFPAYNVENGERVVGVDDLDYDGIPVNQDILEKHLHAVSDTYVVAASDEITARCESLVQEAIDAGRNGTDTTLTAKNILSAIFAELSGRGR